MERRLSPNAVVRELTECVCRRLVRRVIPELQGMSDTPSGYSLGMKSLWDAFCVQVQAEPCGFWALYEAAVEKVVARHVAELEPFERDAVWLCTTRGNDWDCEDEDARDPYPVLDHEVVTHIVGEYLHPEAERWSNPKIRAYLDGR